MSAAIDLNRAFPASGYASISDVTSFQQVVLP